MVSTLTIPPISRWTATSATPLCTATFGALGSLADLQTNSAPRLRCLPLPTSQSTIQDFSLPCSGSRDLCSSRLCATPRGHGLWCFGGHAGAGALGATLFLLRCDCSTTLYSQERRPCHAWHYMPILPLALQCQWPAPLDAVVDAARLMLFLFPTTPLWMSPMFASCNVRCFLRGITTSAKWPFCSQDESIDHLLFTCRRLAPLWAELNSLCHSPQRLLHTWEGELANKIRSTVLLAILWNIWKRCNGKVFRNDTNSYTTLPAPRQMIYACGPIDEKTFKSKSAFTTGAPCCFTLPGEFSLQLSFLLLCNLCFPPPYSNHHVTLLHVTTLWVLIIKFRQA